MLTLSVALLEPVRAGRKIGENQKKSNEPVCRAMLPARHAPSPSFVTDLLRGHVDLGTQDKWLQSWTAQLGSRSKDIVVPSLAANSATAVASAVQGAIVDISVGPDNQLEFQPSVITINVGDTVRWTFASVGHDIVSGGSCQPNNQFCWPNNSNCGSNGSA